MSNVSQDLSLGDAASYFLSRLPVEEKGASQQEVSRFTRWFGRERALAGLTAAEVANYAERLSTSDTDYMRKLELVRAFLAYAKKEGWSKTNLAVHLKARKGKARPRLSSRRETREDIVLTRQRYAELEAELITLEHQRGEAIEEIRRAAADKDFRENVPLEAARERRGHLEGRIRELEEVLKSASIIDEQEKTAYKAGVGNIVVLQDLESGEEINYTLVDPREVNPSMGKISSVSPIGKAIVGRGEGDMVEIDVPAGKLRYQIKQIRG